MEVQRAGHGGRRCKQRRHAGVGVARHLRCAMGHGASREVKSSSCGCSPGLGMVGSVAQGGRRRGRAAPVRWQSRRGRRGTAMGSNFLWRVQDHAAKPGIRSVRARCRWWHGIAVAEPLTGGGSRRKFPRMQGSRSATVGSEVFLASGRSSSCGLRRRSGGRAAGPRWRRGPFATELCGTAARV